MRKKGGGGGGREGKGAGNQAESARTRRASSTAENDIFLAILTMHEVPDGKGRRE